MSFEEEFDKKVRQKAEGVDYPFDSSNWEKASRMIDAERLPGAVKAAGKSYASLGIGLFVGTAVLVSLLYLNRETKAGGSASTDTRINGNELAVSLEPKTVDLNETHPDAIPSSLPNKIEYLSQKAQGLAESVSVNSSSQDKQVFKNQLAPKDNLGGESESVITDQSKANNSSINPTYTEVEHIANIAEKRAYISDNSDTGKGMINSEPEKNDPVKATEIQNDHEVNNDNNARHDPATSDSGRGISEITAMNYEFLSSIQPYIAFDEGNLDIDNLMISPLKCYDEDYYKKGGKTKTHFLNIEIGTKYLSGWKTDRGKDGIGFNWFGGFNYGYYLTRKIVAGVGVQGYSIENITQPFSISKETEYNFGSAHSSTVITSNSLYYLALPVNIYYSLNSSNQLGLGFTPSYLIDSRSTVFVSDKGDYVPESQSTANKQKGVYEGVNKMSYALSIAYRLRITRKISVNAGYIYSLTDIFTNNSEIKNLEKANGFSFGLQFTLFDK